MDFLASATISRGVLGLIRLISIDNEGGNKCWIFFNNLTGEWPLNSIFEGASKKKEQYSSWLIKLTAGSYL